MGIYIKNEVINYGLVLLLFFFCIQKTLVHELYFRYISPALIFRGEINIYNIVGICILSAFGIAILFVSKRKIVLLSAFSLCFCVLILFEIKYEIQIKKEAFVFQDKDIYTIEYNPILSEEVVEHISNILHETEKYMNHYGFPFKAISYRMDYSIYFLWESSQQKVFMTNQEGVCNINFYSDSLCNISDEELITRYIYSVLDRVTQLQEIAIELLVDDVISQVIFNESSPRITDFSYDKLIETYGYCASPKQCLIAECMQKDPKSLSSLYDALGKASTLQEMNIDMVGASSEYKIIFRKIVE